MHRIDLANKNIRCDLIGDIDFKGQERINEKNIKIERIDLNAKDAKKINKTKGTYISIYFDDATDTDKRNDIIDVVSIELKNLLIEKKLLGKPSLIVGLGNPLSTPDSLGPKTIDNIIATRYLFELGDDVDKKYSSVAKISPLVFATTGIETFDILKGIIEQINPSFLIIIDALASTSIGKVNKVIQITDSGIDPGSGVGNQRKELTKKSLGVDIIAIGIPTVVNLHTIVKDILNDYDIDDILKQKDNNFMVTPKEIDFTIEKLSHILSKSINNAVHNMTK